MSTIIRVITRFPKILEGYQTTSYDKASNCEYASLLVVLKHVVEIKPLPVSEKDCYYLREGEIEKIKGDRLGLEYHPNDKPNIDKFLNFYTNNFIMSPDSGKPLVCENTALYKGDPKDLVLNEYGLLSPEFYTFDLITLLTDDKQQLVRCCKHFNCTPLYIKLLGEPFPKLEFTGVRKFNTAILAEAEGILSKILNLESTGE